MNDADWRRHNWPPPPESTLGEHVPDAVMPDRLTNAHEKHWQDCALCQRRVARAAAAVDTFDEASNEEFAAAVSARFADGEPPVSVRLPETVALGLFGPATPDDVGVDQIWQLRWQSRACLVAAVAVRGWHVTVAPVTTDVHLAGGDTVVMDASSSPLQVPTAVWLSVSAAVPMATFARKVGAFACPEGAGSLRAALQAVRRTGEVGGVAPHGVPGQEVGIDTVEVADVLQQDLAWFASADRALTETLDTGGISRDVDVASLLRGLTAAQLAEAGVRKADLLPVLRGEQMTDSQAATLAPILDVDPADLVGGAAFPEALIEELSSPRWFGPRRGFYEANGLTDPEGLSTLARSAQFALAARASGVAAHATDWRARVAWVLADYLDAPDE